MEKPGVWRASIAGMAHPARLRHSQPSDEQLKKKNAHGQRQIARAVAADVTGLADIGGAGMSLGHVMRLQHSAGNRTAARYVMRHTGGGKPGTIQRFGPWGKKSSQTGMKQKRKQIRALQQHGTVKVDDDDIAGIDTVGEGVGDALSYGADLTGAPGDTLGNFAGETTRFGDAEWDEDAGTGDKPVRFMDSTQQDQAGAVAAGMGTVGAGLGALGSGVGTVLAVMKLVKLINATGPKEKGEIAKTIIDIFGGGVTTVAGAGQVMSGSAQSIAQGVASTGNEAASTASDVASGITDSLGGLGGMVEAFVGLIKGVWGTVDYFRSISKKGWKQGSALADVGGELLKSFKGFMVAGKSILSAANTFLELAGAGAEFIQAFPVVGAAINIVVQLVDGLITTIDTVKRAIKLVKAAVMASKLKDMTSSTVAGVADFAKGMVEVNKKRWQRQIIPLVSNVMTLFADLTSICGSVLNIVGVATAAAYGAGVGLMAAGYAAAGFSAITKIGAAGLKGGQKLVRWGKQEIRDLGKGGKGATPNAGPNRFYRMGKKFGINMEKTSSKKTQDLTDQIDWLLKHLKTLPDPIPDEQTDPQGYKGAVIEYENAYLLVKSTGVNVKELTSASDGDELVKILAVAIKARE